MWRRGYWDRIGVVGETSGVGYRDGKGRGRAVNEFRELLLCTFVVVVPVRLDVRVFVRMGAGVVCEAMPFKTHATHAAYVNRIVPGA